MKSLNSDLLTSKVILFLNASLFIVILMHLMFNQKAAFLLFTHCSSRFSCPTDIMQLLQFFFHFPPSVKDRHLAPYLLKAAALSSCGICTYTHTHTNTHSQCDSRGVELKGRLSSGGQRKSSLIREIHWHNRFITALAVSSLSQH